jgi:2-methylcitrate dehydratase PrpD
MAAPIDFIHDLRWADVPPQTQARTRVLLRDLLGVAAAGLSTRLSRIVRDHAAAQFGAGAAAACILFDGRRVSPAGAALAGGMTIDAFDAHDGHRLTKGHAGCGALPAALAMAETTGAESLEAVLVGLLLGYEIGTRAGVALHRTAADDHTSGAWGPVACVAIAARALKLDAAATREALGIAEYHGPRSPMMRCIDHPTMVKDGSGWGALAGVSAAYLAADGFTGAPALTVEGADVADLWSDLGALWRVGEQYVKPWPVCRWAQPATHAALTLRAAHGLTGDAIEAVEIETFAEAARLAGARPRSTEAAQYAIAFPVAAALSRGRLGAAEVAEAALDDPEILRLSGATRLIRNAACDAAFPARRLSAVRLRLRDGRVLDSGVVEAPGDPENFLAETALAEKYAALAAPALGSARAEALSAACMAASSTPAEMLLELISSPTTAPGPAATRRPCEGTAENGAGSGSPERSPGLDRGGSPEPFGLRRA